jgi:2,5-furandicarboxylate decarboxylase 1
MVVKYKDLREYIDLLKENGELVEINKPVNQDYEPTAILTKLEQNNRYDAVLFNNVQGLPGWRIMGNTFATRKKIALALGCAEEKVAEEFRIRVANPIAPKMVQTGPIKENVVTGSDIDLTKLPIITHHEKDAGRYISYGITVAKDPENGIRNVGIYRNLIKGKDYMVPSYAGMSNITTMFSRAEQMGKPLEIAIMPGVDPLIALAASHTVPYGVDEYTLAGGLRGEPVELVRCETVDLEVPASAEVVIEAEVLPGKREPEAPFADWSGCYSRVKYGPIVKPKAITFRNNPIHQFIFTGHPDYWNMTAVGFEAITYDIVKKVSPNVVGVHIPTTNPLMCCIAMKKIPTVEGREAGIQKQVILAALAFNPFLKLVIVVDDDVDITRDEEILWALGFRFQAVDPVTGEDKMFVIPGAAGTRADPSNFHNDYPSAKVGIDATVRSDIKEEQKIEFERAKCVGVDKVDLKSLLSL